MNNPSRLGHSPNAPEGHTALGLFQLSPDITYLNHGAYGAVPKSVGAEQERFRALIERNPTAFYKEFLPSELRRLAGVVASRFGGAASDWVFCENATAAVNSVLSSFTFREGDEVVTTSHAYGAVLRALQTWTKRSSAKLIVAELPAFIKSEDQIASLIRERFTDRTRLLVVDHITSATAIVFPIARIVQAARDAGIAVLVDGAHAPGQVPVDVEAIGADWYTGNAHKWLFAPKGCGLLWTAPSRQPDTLPAVLSHGTPDGYAAAFDWIGTRDFTPWLCFEVAASAHDAFGGADLMARNRALAAEGASFLVEAVQARAAAPESLQAAMASLALAPAPAENDGVNMLQRTLSGRFEVVVPVFDFAGRLWIRISAQIYNEMADYERLAKGLAYFLDATEGR